MIEDKASIRVQKICGVQENVHRKELTLDLGKQGELVELVVFRGKRINYEYGTVSVTLSVTKRNKAKSIC
jgi:hypothetical protein